MTPRAAHIDRRQSVLLLVDYQQRLMPVIAGGAEVVDAALRLAQAARLLGIPVLGTEQTPHKLGALVAPLREHCTLRVDKTHFDACEDGLLDALNASSAPQQIVIGGCEAHVCLLQTALGLLRAGHVVWVVEAACGARHHADLRLAMQRLHQAGAVIVSPDMVMFEWLGSSADEQFREVLPLVKRDAGA